MKDVFSLPNLLTYIRIALVPIFVVLFFTLPIYYAFSVYVLAVLTDVVDGFIARKYSLGSNLGKVLDPFADKILKITVVACFVIIHLIPVWFLIAVMVIDVALMVFATLLFKREIIIKSNVVGKAGTIVISIGIIFAFFYAFVGTFYLYILYLGLATMFASAITYLVVYLKINKQIKG